MAKRGINFLDDLQIKRWVAAAVPIARTDGGGLTFTLSKAGTATFVLRYMRAGRPKELTLGNYPDLTLAAARKLAREHRVAIDQGGDPAANKQLSKMRASQTWTINRLADDYIDKQLTPENYSHSTLYYRKQDIDNIVRPKLGSLEVQLIAPSDIVYVIETTGRTWTINRRILITMGKLFDHAIAKKLIPANPCTGVKLTALLGARPKVKKRIMLTADEIRSLLSNIEFIGTCNALAFRILLATCVRSIELTKAKWEDIDFEAKTWIVHDDAVKTRQGFLVPLTPTVEKWFLELKEYAGSSAYALPARDDRRTRNGDTHVGPTTLWAAITRAFERGEIETRKFTPHDTRSTAKGHMRNLGISKEISELALNHKLQGMDAIYDVRTDIPERRNALEIWAKFIDEIESKAN